MLNRQKVVLAMLRDSGGTASRLQLTKWLFLLSQESPSKGGSSFYQFVPYKHGPYSFTLYQEVDGLIRDGYIKAPDDQTWRLTAEGKGYRLALPGEVQRHSREIVRFYGHLNTAQLLATVYKRYGWFTVKADAHERRAMMLPTAEPGIYTMGYEGLLVDGFLNTLLLRGVRRIIDVRHNPTSRRFGFHRSTLARICRYLDLEYEHIPELGIPSQERSGLTAEAEYEALFTAYRRDTLPAQSMAIERVAAMVAEKPSTLMCMEADPASCHRSRLADALVPLVQLPIEHLVQCGGSLLLVYCARGHPGAGVIVRRAGCVGRGRRRSS